VGVLPAQLVVVAMTSGEPRVSDEKLAEMIQGIEDDPEGVDALEYDTLYDLRDCRRELAAMPHVECACHPGVRWPDQTWGQTCPISKAEEALAAALAREQRLRLALLGHRGEVNHGLHCVCSGCADQRRAALAESAPTPEEKP
jgi:hypothetical protein